MIDRTQLTEALAVYPELHGGLPYEFEECATVEAAARLLLDFPTDQQVEAAANALKVEHPQWTKTTARKVAWAALVAVRDTMIGDGQ